MTQHSIFFALTGLFFSVAMSACSPAMATDSGMGTDVPSASDTPAASDSPTAGDTGGNPTDAPTGGDAMGGPSQAAVYFCDMGYANVCRYGGMNRYPDRAACLAAYDGYSQARQLCVANALGMMNCDAATGLAPCAM